MKIAKYVILRNIGQQRFGQPCIIKLVLLFASYEEITAVLIDTWSLQQV